jgi:hypothetical protein
MEEAFFLDVHIYSVFLVLRLGQIMFFMQWSAGRNGLLSDQKAVLG